MGVDSGEPAWIKLCGTLGYKRRPSDHPLAWLKDLIRIHHFPLLPISPLAPVVYKVRDLRAQDHELLEPEIYSDDMYLGLVLAK